MWSAAALLPLFFGTSRPSVLRGSIERRKWGSAGFLWNPFTYNLRYE
jgi:hypothetical protein